MKSTAIFLMMLLCGFLLAGCRSLNVPDDSTQQPEQLPWNTPASWENSIIGIPY